MKNEKTRMSASLFLAPAVALLLLFSACAQSSRPYTAEMGNELRAARGIKNLRALPVVEYSGDELLIHMDEKFPVFEHRLGKSYVALVKLPPYAPASLLEVKSPCECIGLRKSVYIPLGEVLDADFRTLRPLDFITRGDDGAYYYAVDQVLPEDRYLFIYSDPKRYGEYADGVNLTTTTTRIYDRKSQINTDKYETVVETTTTTGGLWWRGSPLGTISVKVSAGK